MKQSLEFLRADVRDELEKIARIVTEFQEAEERTGLPETPLPNYDRGAIGYLLHGFYNGCENVFRSIARFFENDVNPMSWHRDLLRRMTLDVPGFRPRVIDDELYRLLDDFRGFRHRFRHSYAFELDWERERAVALRLPRAAALFREQVGCFLENLKELSSED